MARYAEDAVGSGPDATAALPCAMASVAAATSASTTHSLRVGSASSRWAAAGFDAAYAGNNGKTVTAALRRTGGLAMAD